MSKLFWRAVGKGGNGDFEAQIKRDESYFVITIEGKKFKLKRINRTTPKEELGVYNSLQEAKNAAERNMGRVAHAFSATNQVAAKELQKQYGSNWMDLSSGL